jgi:hypothetical protein
MTLLWLLKGIKIAEFGIKNKALYNCHAQCSPRDSIRCPWWRYFRGAWQSSAVASGIIAHPQCRIPLQCSAVQCSTVQCSAVQCSLHPGAGKVRSPCYPCNSTQCALHCTQQTALHCVICSVHCTPLHTLHPAHCSLHTAHCTLHLAHCTLHTRVGWFGFGVSKLAGHLGLLPQKWAGWCNMSLL